MNKVSLILILGLMILGFVSGAEDRISIIVLEENLSNEKTMGISAMSMSSNIKDNLDIVHEYSNINGFSAEVTSEELEELKKTGANIFIDRIFHATLDVSIPLISATNSWELQTNEINMTGAGQTVCVIDTGVNYSHPSLGGCYGDNDPTSDCKIIGGYDFVNDDPYPMDDQGHGTHVAGIIISSNATYKGVAPGSKIIAMKVLNSSGSGSGNDVGAAIDWCVSNSSKFNISVISMSLGDCSNHLTYCNSDFLASFINNSKANGIPVVISSGNCDQSKCPGQPCTSGPSSPGCVESAITVGCTDDSDTISYMRGPLFQLMAPGFGIISTLFDGGTGSKSGTSMSAPHVSGAIAIITQHLDITSRTKTTEELEEILNDTGVYIDDTAESGYSFSRINVYNALLSLDNVAPSVTLVSPSNGHVNLSTNQSFVCNATDWQLANVTFKIWNSTELYYNETKNLTGAENGTTFNLIDMPEESYTWNCFVVDDENNLGVASTNFSLTVGGVEVNLNSPENNSATNVNETSFNCSSFSDANYELVSISFNLWNSTGALIKNETKNISGFENVTIFNYTFTMEDNYTWQCVAINNNSDIGNGVNFTITYDVSIPTISGLIAENVGSSSATIIWTTDEETNSSVGGDVGGNNSEYTTSHSVAISGLSASTLYSYNVTSCDRAGNCDNDTGSFTTTSAPSSGGGGGIRAETYVVEDKEFRLGKTEELKEKDKMSFFLASGKHELKAIDVRSDSVDIVIQSNPIYLTLAIGEELKLNMSSPLYYDLVIRLNSIRSRKANITITRILEEIEKEIVENETEEIVENETEDGDKIYHITKDGKTNYKPYIFGIVIALVVFIGILLKIKSKKLKASKTNDKYGKKTKAKTVGKR